MNELQAFIDAILRNGYGIAIHDEPIQNLRLVEIRTLESRVRLAISYKSLVDIEEQDRWSPLCPPSPYLDEVEFRIVECLRKLGDSTNLDTVLKEFDDIHKKYRNQRA